MASRRSVNKDDNFYKRVIHRSHQRILEDLEPLSILDLFLETEYIPYTQVRDIQELRLSSEKTREIVKKVSSKGAEGYKRFKILLGRSQQEHLIDTLNEQELALEREMAQRNQELGILRVPNDIELYSIAAHIGLNWEMLGPFLGIPTTTIDQIKLDNSSTIQKIYRMLFVWRAMNGREATLQKLLSQMQNAPGAVNIDWNPLKEDIAKFDTINRTSSATATVGARPNTTENSQQQMLYEREAADRMQQLRIEQPTGNQRSLDQSAGSGFEIAKHNEDSYRASQRPQTLTSFDPSVIELGNTRRQGEFQSNVIGPDVSGKSFNSRNRPDGPPNEHTQVSNQAVSVDQTDAVRRRSLEQNNPTVNPDTSNTVATTSAELQAVASVPSYTEPEPTAGSFSTEQKVAGETANTVLHTVDTPKGIASSGSGEELQSSLDTIKKEIGKVEGVLRENTSLPVPAVVAGKNPRNKQDDQDSVDGREKRANRLKAIFDSGENMKGRLRVLTALNIKDLLKSSTHKSELKGGFGDIYVSNEKIPGLDLRVVVKKVDLKVNEATQKMRSLTSEKLSARTMHFAIVPLLGIREDTINRVYYFLSPYMENGNLNQAIEEDTKRLARDEKHVLTVGLRIKIMYQIASAIDFLHTPVKDIRGMILHMDIKSLNIVLDKAYNARLIDFGLAREMKEGHDHTKTTSHYYSSPGYGKLTEQQIRARHDDYRYFGVVIRELLTGKKPSVEGCPEEELVTQIQRKIKSKLLTMWKKLEIVPSVSDILLGLSTRCIEDKDLDSKFIVKQLKEVVVSTKTSRWDNDTMTFNKSKKCDMCLEYKAVQEKILAHNQCENNMDMHVCVSCMRNFYCNPIHCHSCCSDDITIHPTIGHGWAALLVAGDDRMDSVAKSFKDDIVEVRKVITSKWPLVMGVSDDHVQSLYPEDNMEEKIKNAVGSLKTLPDIQTLLVYISGHYKHDVGGFELRSEKEYLSIGELQRYIAEIFYEAKSTKRAIVFFDCCSAPSVTVAAASPTDERKKKSTVQSVPAEAGDISTIVTKGIEKELVLEVPDISIVQINACGPGQTSVQEPGGSLFRQFLLQGLTRCALNGTCVYSPECPLPTCRIEGDFVTVSNLHDYISKHMNSKTLNQGDCVMYVHKANTIDVKIGYVINFKVDLQFTYRFKEKKEHDEISQRMFCELSELQTVLFDKYIEKMELDKPKDGEPKLNNTDFCEILCIEVEKGPKKHHRDRLTSLQRIMTAWNAKRELVVSLRTMSEISEGMVGEFLSADQGVESIIEFLRNSKIVRIDQKGYATICAINLSTDFGSVIEAVDGIESKNSSMATFLDHLIEVEDALNKLKQSDSTHFEELHIVFPCKSGTRKHRRDFLCYQLKERNAS